MIIDVTGIELTPGNKGKDCMGNGKYKDDKGEKIECCCDECNYLMCCSVANWKKLCAKCGDNECPRAN